MSKQFFVNAKFGCIVLLPVFFLSFFTVSAQITKSPFKGNKGTDSVVTVSTPQANMEQPSAEIKMLSEVLPSKFIDRHPYISAQQIVKGNLSGVYVQEPSGEPGVDQNIFVRGISSPLLSKRELFDQQAVVFLNGIPLTQDNPFAYEVQKYDFNRIGPATNLLASIPVDNIESVQVIKDPYTLAKLGPIASNGAIWIVTKNAKSGNRQILINSYYGFNTPPSITPVNAAYENNFRTPFYDKFGTVATRLNYPPYLRDSTNADYYGPANWKDEYYNMASLYNVDFSLTGGSERANFRFYGGATKNASSADKTSLSRYTGSFFINVAPIKWLMISSMINYSRMERVRNKNIRDRLAEQRYIPDLTNPLTPNKILYQSYLGEFNKAIDDNSNNVIQGYFTIAAKLKKLNYISRLAFDYNEGIRDVFWPRTLLEGNNFVSNYFGYNQRMVISNTLSYELPINLKQKIVFQGGQLFQGDTYKYDYAFAYNGPNDFVKINVVDPINLQPAGFRVYYYPSKMRLALVSFFGNASFTVNEALKLNIAISRDGSSNMQPDNRWNTNYAGSAEWDLKNQFNSTFKKLSSFTATASYAKLGKLLSDDRFNAGAQYRVDMGWTNEPTVGSYAGIPGISRPYTSGWIGYGIPWAYSEQYNVALRIANQNNRIRLGVDLYNKTDKQMLLAVPVPSEWGYSGAYKPGMSVRNYGADIDVVADLFNSKSHRIGWALQANMGINNNKLVALPDNLKELTTGNNRLEVGKRIDGFWVLKNTGTFNDNTNAVPINPQTSMPLTYRGFPLKSGDPQWVDINHDYVINDNDKLLKGNYIPYFTGGIGNSISYKSFSLDIQLYMVLGRKILNQYASSHYDFVNVEVANNINSVKEITYWEKKADLSGYPLYNPWSPIVPYRLDQDLFLEDGSFLKLRSLSLNYELNSSKNRKASKTWLFYITGTNLLTVTRFSGDDPELVNYNGIYTGYGLPLSPTIITGFKVSL